MICPLDSRYVTPRYILISSDIIQQLMLWMQISNEKEAERAIKRYGL